jgi:hypothetical protein
MAAIRNGSRVCLIMAMHQRGTVVELFERQHKSMLIDGPLSRTMWARVKLDSPGAGVPVLVCRIGDLMTIDDPR